MQTHAKHLRLVSSTPGPGTGQDAIAHLEVDHALQMELCDVLEHLADGLPHDVDMSLARVAIAILRNGVPQHTAFEEELFFPLLRRRTEGDATFQLILDQLESEHECDESYTEEIAAELERLIETGNARNPEMLGYMLRGYFVSHRRHVEWENATVIPMARRVFSVEDLGELNRGLELKPHITEGREFLATIPEDFSISRCNGACEDCKSRQDGSAAD